MSRIYRTFRVLVSNELSARMAYRGDFAIGVVVSLVTQMLLPMMTVLIYGAGASYPGWTLYEALLVQAIFIMSNSVAGIFFFGMVGVVLNHIRQGTFDLFMIKPAPAALLAAGMSFSLDSVFELAGGLLLFIVAYANTGGADGSGWIKFTIVFVMSILVLLGFTFLISAVLFKWVGNSRMFEIFMSVARFGQYPASVYPKAFRIVISYVFPVALFGSVPAEVLLKPTGTLDVVLAAVFAVVFLGAGYSVWRLMLRIYTSSGG